MCNYLLVDTHSIIRSLLYVIRMVKIHEMYVGGISKVHSRNSAIFPEDIIASLSTVSEHEYNSTKNFQKFFS
jgi:hypothetical protein